jgi:hypothetical protein
MQKCFEAGVFGLIGVAGLWIGDWLFEWTSGDVARLDWLTVWWGCAASFFLGRNLS